MPWIPLSLLCGVTVLWQHCFLSMNNVIKLLIEWRNMPLAVYGILILKASSWLKQITFRMERSSGISKAGTIRPSLWVSFCKNGHPICKSLAIPENGWTMVVSCVNSIYPITSDFCGSTFGGHLSYQELGSHWPWSMVNFFLEFVPRSHISNLCTPSFKALAGYLVKNSIKGTGRKFQLTLSKLS